ncbi:hypothetical protein ACA910_006290 [Epithemia clementina (nom. ined.)]
MLRQCHSSLARKSGDLFCSHSRHVQRIRRLPVHATVTRTFVFRHSFRQHDEPRKPRKLGKDSPFSVLGVSEAEDYKAVKRNFLKLAMKHHPDTAQARTKDEVALNREIFMNIRAAFESIVEGPQGIAILRSESDKKWEEEELNNWFKQETGGFDMPFLDPKTIKEVADMTTKLGGDAGLDRDGGMWTLARMVTQNVKSGGDGASILQLEAGEERSREINGILRRKRRF